MFGCCSATPESRNSALPQSQTEARGDNTKVATGRCWALDVAKGIVTLSSSVQKLLVKNAKMDPTDEGTC